MDWVERYMENMGMLWDIGSSDTSRVMDTVEPIGYMMVQDDSLIDKQYARVFIGTR
jgi:hypothetical protein